MADILIRGMEMPETCGECPCISQWDDCEINHEWKFADKFDKTKDRLPSCPLVPLPEGHGRLIDADEIADQAVEIAQKTEGSVEKWAMLFAAELVRNSPTIIEADGGGGDG